jgi:RND superfamily putative drug exporter
VIAASSRGLGASLIGVRTTLPIPAYVPMLVFAIVFGLSMDYGCSCCRVHGHGSRPAIHRAVAVGIGAAGHHHRGGDGGGLRELRPATDPTVNAPRRVAAQSDRRVAGQDDPGALGHVLLDARAWWMPRWLEPVVPNLRGSTTL